MLEVGLKTSNVDEAQALNFLFPIPVFWLGWQWKGSFQPVETADSSKAFQ